MYNMENNPNRYYQMLQNYKEAQFLFAAIRLNIFSYLDTPVTVDVLSEKLKYDKKRLELLLMSLVSCELIGKLGDYYANTPETKDFLSRNSNIFLGDAILFREKIATLEGLDEKLKTEQSPGKNNYDFETIANATLPEMYAGRVQSFIKEMKKLFANPQHPLHILDLGGGSGVLAIEFVKHFPGSKAFVFETPELTAITERIIRQNKVEEDVGLISGDFASDDFGDNYDLIITSGILNFVNIDLSSFAEKLSVALRDDANLLIIEQYTGLDYNAPANILSSLSGFLNGFPLPPDRSEIDGAMKGAGLNAACFLNDTFLIGTLYRKGAAEYPVCSSDVIRAFIELTEQIANSKTNILDFGSEDMTFYRGEIHMIKMIGDFPGIYSAELARKFGITRPVVHKTLQKLSKRKLITKEDDEENKKRFQLYLTEKGWAAYRYHQEYHERYDKALFDYVGNITGDQLTCIKGFLDHAIELIRNHA